MSRGTTRIPWCPTCDVGSLEARCWNCGRDYTAAHIVPDTGDAPQVVAS